MLQFTNFIETNEFVILYKIRKVSFI